MDLKQFEGLAKVFDEGVWLDILYPANHSSAGKKTGLRVHVASYMSERVKKVQRRITNVAIRENRRNPKKIGTVEEIEEKTSEIVASAIIGWEGFEVGGKPLEFTHENVMSILDNPDLWFIGEQVDKLAEDQGSFTKA